MYVDVKIFRWHQVNVYNIYDILSIIKQQNLIAFAFGDEIMLQANTA